MPAQSATSLGRYHHLEEEIRVGANGPVAQVLRAEDGVAPERSVLRRDTDDGLAVRVKGDRSEEIRLGGVVGVKSPRKGLLDPDAVRRDMFAEGVVRPVVVASRGSATNNTHFLRSPPLAPFRAHARRFQVKNEK